MGSILEANWGFTYGVVCSIIGARMEFFKRLLSNRRFCLLVAAALLAGMILLLLGWKFGVDGAVLGASWKQLENFLLLRPWLLFAGLVILPALPVPTSALLLLAGTVWRDTPVMACGICLLALGINITWTYWLAAYPGRGMVVKLMAFLGLALPESSKDNHLRLILLVRLTPGFPFFVQNYLLGFFRVPFWLYLPVSLCCSGIISAGVVLSAAGVADGNLVPIFTGVALIVVGFLVVQWIKARILKRGACNSGERSDVGGV